MHAPDPAQKVLKPVGEWNTTRLVVRGSHVEHWLNEKKVLEFERWTPEWNTLRDSGKWKTAPDYGKAKTGRIAHPGSRQHLLVQEREDQGPRGVNGAPHLLPFQSRDAGDVSLCR